MRISLRFLFLLNDRMGRFGTVDGKMICRSSMSLSMLRALFCLMLLNVVTIGQISGIL